MSNSIIGQTGTSVRHGHEVFFLGFTRAQVRPIPIYYAPSLWTRLHKSGSLICLFRDAWKVSQLSSLSEQYTRFPKSESPDEFSFSVSFEVEGSTSTLMYCPLVGTWKNGFERYAIVFP